MLNSAAGLDLIQVVAWQQPKLLHQCSIAQVLASQLVQQFIVA
jgi:hypothetical protein